MNHMYIMRRLALFSFSLLTALLSFSATFTVTNTNDSGPGSLRQAIIDANLTPGADAIVFNIAAPPYIISPLSALPSIDETVSINGYTQPTSVIGTMAARQIRIVISGVGAGGAANGLTLNADGIEIAGLVINSFAQSGINVLNGVDNLVIWGNFIGTDATGTVDQGNGNHGISLGDLGPGGSDAVLIGTNSDGLNDDSEGNLISGNGQDGIIGWALTNSVMTGNFIGSNRFGIGTTLGNGRNGILLTVNSTDNRIGTDGDGVNDTQELNGIIMNVGRGIYLAANANNNAVSGNIVGINTTGAAAGNLTHGIEVLNSSNNRIGVDVSTPNFIAQANVVSSNAGNGILLTAHDFFGIFNFNTTGNVVAGNYIGTTPTNTTRGNAFSGITLEAADGLLLNDNVIGSNNDGDNDAAEGNIIAYNSIIGLGTTASADINGNIVSRNSFHNNANLGMDLSSNGVTANDDGDPDTGPQELFNFPVIKQTYTMSGSLIVAGITRPNSIVEVYVDDGSGEGMTFLFRAQEGTTLNGIADNATGTDTYTDPVFAPVAITDERFEFTVLLSSIPAFAPGSRLVALAIKSTAGDNSTSEFGPSLQVLPVTLTTFQGVLVDGAVKLTWSTSREVNSSHFVVEKNVEGTKYIPIGTVKAGAGQYSFTDNTPLGKFNYYRLKIADNDGNFGYSKVLIIRNDVSNVVLKMTPNPVSTQLNVSFRLEQDETVTINMYDQMGRITKRYTVRGSRGLNAFTFTDLGNLPAGSYAVEVTGKTISAKQQIMKK